MSRIFTLENDISFYKKIKGKKIEFKFQSKNEEKEYREICENIWGGVPCDVNWAKETNLYKQYK